MGKKFGNFDIQISTDGDPIWCFLVRKGSVIMFPASEIDSLKKAIADLEHDAMNALSERYAEEE